MHMSVYACMGVGISSSMYMRVHAYIHVLACMPVCTFCNPPPPASIEVGFAGFGIPNIETLHTPMVVCSFFVV